MATDLMGFEELSRSIGARLFRFSHVTGFSSVAIDSRAVKQGGLFIALEGSSGDGHDFVTRAFEAGARGAMVKSSKLEKCDLVNAAKKMNKQLVVVENTLKGFQDSARVYLEKFPGLLKIGITGSSGKTTTKEITASILACEKNTVMNRGNLNSETGLPLSVFEVHGRHETGVFELGMNRPNEISELAEVLKPNIALVTNIGSAHIEYFGSKSKIVNEKKCIFKFLKDDDVALIPKNDEYAQELSQGASGKIKFYAEECFDELEGTRSLGLDGTEIFWAGEKIRFSLPGGHCLQDAMAAIAIAKEAAASNDAIKQGLESVRPLFGRQEILRGRTTVIRDCYNANPESTAKSVEFCDTLDWPSRKVYVLADMLELGDQSAAAHARLGGILSESRAQGIFLFGPEIKAAFRSLEEKNRSFFHTDDIDTLSHVLDNYVQAGDLVLLKGSRGCALERLTGMLTGADNVS
jgi:UDP-N-acetylmuramoyl-tripeptide--D-alanyl-D-alanine ligase